MAAKLILKSCLLLALTAVLDGSFLLSPVARSTLENDYLAGWTFKHRLLVGQGQRRLIVTGGSNVAFGVDSSLLERSTGRRTINVALHAGLGLDHILNETAEGARAGDLVLLISEYEHFFRALANGELTVAQVLMYDPSSLRYVRSWGQWHTLAGSVAAMSGQAAFDVINTAQRRLRGKPILAIRNPVYRSDAFDGHGDVVSHLSQPSRPVPVSHPPEIDGDFNTDAVQSLHRFAEVLEARGVRLLVTYPSVTRRYFEINRDQIARVARAMPARVTRSQPEDWVFDEALFHDTWYHLNGQGRRLRTERLARLVSSFANEETAPRLTSSAPQ